MTTQAVRAEGTVRTRARSAWRPVMVVLAAVGLFFLYLRQSGSVPLSSDGASVVLQARAVLHGNLLLHNWRLADVTFYTTELPQYALIESVLGLNAWVVHVGAAMTYTLLVVLAAVLASGGRPPQTPPHGGTARPPVPPRGRALLAAGIMVAPQLSATQIVLLSPDHTGTGVPLLVTWLIIDRVTPDRWKAARWVVPLVVFAILTWTMVGDSIVLVTCIAPLVLVVLIRSCPGLIRRGERPASRWYELSLAGAAALAGGLGSAGPRIISALGGYRQAPVESDTTVAALQHQSWVTLQAVLELFGANVFDARPAIEVVFVWLHLAGAILVIWALGLALARFFRFQDLVIPVFAVAIVFNVVAYMFSAHALDILGAREIAAVLPLGAVLAGRLLAEPLLGAAQTGRRTRRWLVPALMVVIAGYLGTLGYAAAQPPAPPANQPLANWLAAHRLTDGLAGYWQANSTTLASGGRVKVSGVTVAPDGELVPYEWEAEDTNYDPSRHDATFMVAGGPSQLLWAQPAAVRTFGPPQRTYQYDGYTIMVWDTNLLSRLGHPGLI
ncbi:MAG TPA: hypothetical protein VMA97_00425 [Streptosporangiaceae bacterium]|nr:hypothetical protein [Streptosporangiaceae bacterium]